MKTGYYIVKFYNHNRLKVLYWTGDKFEGFPSDPTIHDEIERVDLLELQTYTPQTDVTKN